MVMPFANYLGILAVGLWLNPAAYTVAIVAASAAVILTAITTSRRGERNDRRNDLSGNQAKPQAILNGVVRLTLVEWYILGMCLDTGPKRGCEIHRDLEVNSVNIRSTALGEVLVGLMKAKLVSGGAMPGMFELTDRGRKAVRDSTI